MPQPTSVSVSVYNATTRAGLAKKTAAVLAKDGFKIAVYKNDPANLPITGVAEIRFSPDQKAGAMLLSYYFPNSKMVPLDVSSDSALIVSLGAKFTAVTTTTIARGVMASAHVSQAPVGTTPSAQAPSTNC